jgi:hypothetical protein
MVARLETHEWWCSLVVAFQVETPGESGKEGIYHTPSPGVPGKQERSSTLEGLQGKQKPKEDGGAQEHETCCSRTWVAVQAASLGMGWGRGCLFIVAKPRGRQDMRTVSAQKCVRCGKAQVQRRSVLTLVQAVFLLVPSLAWLGLFLGVLFLGFGHFLIKSCWSYFLAPCCFCGSCVISTPEHWVDPHFIAF